MPLFVSGDCLAAFWVTFVLIIILVPEFVKMSENSDSNRILQAVSRSRLLRNNIIFATLQSLWIEMNILMKTIPHYLVPRMQSSGVPKTESQIRMHLSIKLMTPYRKLEKQDFVVSGQSFTETTERYYDLLQMLQCYPGGLSVLPLLWNQIIC